MAARTARSFLHTTTRSISVFRRVSGQQALKNAVRTLQKSSSAVQVNPALSSLLQNLGKRSSPSFLNHIRRIQDLSINIDVNTSLLLTNDGDSQDTMLEQMCADDDDDQFRTREDTLQTVKDEIDIAQHHGNVFAIVHIGGSQFKITANDIIMVNKLNAELGSRIRLEKILLVGGENFTIVGRPLVNKNTVDVQATVIENRKAKKIIVFKKKRRKNYKRTQGHRQEMTVLRINKISLNSGSLQKK